MIKDIKQNSIPDTSSIFYVDDCFDYSGPNISSLNHTLNNKEYLINHQLYSLTKTKPLLPPIELHNSTGGVVLLLFSFFFIAIAIKKIPYYFKDNFLLIFSESTLDKQQTSKEIAISSCLFFTTLCMLAILVFEKLSLLQSVVNQKPFVTILLFIAIFLVFFLFKIAIYQLYAYILNMKKELRIWKRLFFTVNNIFGIIAFIPICIVVYSNVYHNIIINILLIIFLLVQLFLIIIMMLYFINKNSDYLYLFVYFCSIELLPYIVLGILFLNLYKIDFI